MFVTGNDHVEGHLCGYQMNTAMLQFTSDINQKLGPDSVHRNRRWRQWLYRDPGVHMYQSWVRGYIYLSRNVDDSRLLSGKSISHTVYLGDDTRII